MRIESIHVENFRVFRDATLGVDGRQGLPPLIVLVGANGSGKSTFFDILGFLRDALVANVRTALDKRGGLREVRSREGSGPLVIEIKFRDDGPRITYRLEIDEVDGVPVIERETLAYRRAQFGKPWNFVDFSRGKGEAVTNELADIKEEMDLKREPQILDAPDILAIKGLGQFKQFKAVASFRRMIEAWHVSDFHISEARPSQEAGVAEHLSASGDNLALVARFLFERHPERFQAVLDKMHVHVPGVQKVEAKLTDDGRLVLRFQDGAFKDPFIARHVSDGTIKMFAYLILLNDPAPHSLLCIEEPENQLYPSLLTTLAEEFRLYAQRGGQVMVSTHSPDFLNAIQLDELFWLTKKNGFTTVHRAADDEQLRALVSEGDLPGALWKQGLFAGVHPA